MTGKPFIFAVGADLSGVPQVDRPAHGAREIGRLGHRVFARFAELAVPTFALVNGAAMGGGLEVALHCHVPDDLLRRAARSRCPSASSASCPAGAAPSCCPT